VFPAPGALAVLDPAVIGGPARRARTIVALAGAVAEGRLAFDDTDPGELRDALRAIDGIGPWTADLVLMRACGHPDVLATDDLGIRRALARLDLDPATVPARWAPWRSYAQAHLWAHLDDDPRRTP
jgi:AraC family transcriptional regulator of adaptative response / DNA-3-methyladenine glycosylase II